MDGKPETSNKHQDINDLMLKCISDLNVKSKGNKGFQNKSKHVPMLPKDRTNSIYNEMNSKRFEDFSWINKNNENLKWPELFVNQVVQENWADFDENFNEKKQEILDLKQEKHQINCNSIKSLPVYDFEKKSSLFDVWHAFFTNLKCLYESIYRIFLKQSEIDSDVFNSEKICEYLNCVDETYLVFKRVLVSSNRYVSKKQSHIHNNLKHEIDRLYHNINQLLNRKGLLLSQHSDSIIDSNQQELCNLCLHSIDSKELVQIEHFKYHISCINLWLHCVQSDTLPTLRLNQNKEFDIQCSSFD